jgi:hypothetical protein
MTHLYIDRYIYTMHVHYTYILYILIQIYTNDFFFIFNRLTALTTLGYRDEVRRFRPGLDYTVAHYGCMTTIPRLDATLCFVKEDRIEMEEEEKGEKIEEKKEKNEDDDDDGTYVYVYIYLCICIYVFMKLANEDTYVYIHIN